MSLRSPLQLICFALNFALWVVVPSVFGLFACSVVLGVLFFVGFFGYLWYRPRRNFGRSDKRDILTIAIFLCWPMCAAAADLTGTASVIDGGTIEAHGQRVRLFGIDAPEADQTCTNGGRPYRCGEGAALGLSDFVRERLAACEQRDLDRWARLSFGRGLRYSGVACVTIMRSFLATVSGRSWQIARSARAAYGVTANTAGGN
jgi:hypothetical protein